MHFLIQSDKATPQYLDDRIEKFLTEYRTQLSETTKEKFQENIEALVAKKLEKPKKMNQAAARITAEITSRRYFFNHRKAEAEILKTITLDDVLLYFDTYIAKTGAKRSKLSIRVR